MLDSPEIETGILYMQNKCYANDLLVLKLIASENIYYVTVEFLPMWGILLDRSEWDTQLWRLNSQGSGVFFSNLFPWGKLVWVWSKDTMYVMKVLLFL